jgi:hypothetical protein
VHAQQQPNFGNTTVHCSWLRVYTQELTVSMPPKQHPLSVTRYDGSLEEMAVDMLRMRYDKVSEFFSHCLTEIHRQAASDFIHGKPQLSKELDDAAQECLELREQFARIYRLCRRYMPGAP